MENNETALWKGNEAPVLPAKADVPAIVKLGAQLTARDQRQIINGFESESYEMVSTYIWTKAIIALKTQLGSMGTHFIAEMLDRPDISEHTDLRQAISDFEAVRLAEELGIITGTSAFRLRKAMDTVAHFSNPGLEENEENVLTEEEAKTVIRSCIQGVLGYNKIQVALDFKNFREELESETLDEENPNIIKLVQSPYFFHRATIRILLSIIKSAQGAQLENSLANANLIVPKIWKNLQHPEKYQVGRSYSELFSDGKTKAASGLKQVLLKVKGFDFVPEDLRSNQFIKTANEIISAHENFDNFYNEPAPTQTLYRMGSVIPIPAFPVCMTAVLCVRLGNDYGVSRSAQDSAMGILKNVSKDRWIYFFNECLLSNDKILYKLMRWRPQTRWFELFSDAFIDSIIPEIKQRTLKRLLEATKAKQNERVAKIASELYSNMGYGH